MGIFTGTPGADSLTGGAERDTLAGGAGADTLDGGANADLLLADDQSANFRAWNLNYPTVIPTLDMGTEVDVLRGGDGDDTMVAGYGDHVDGGQGQDSLNISFMGATAGVTASFLQPTLTIGGGVITSAEYVVYVQGSNYSDNITMGGGFFTAVRGMGGDDTLTAAGATSAMFGDDGADYIDARPSSYISFVDGGDGDDVIYSGFGTTLGGAGNDTIHATGQIDGGAGDDLIYGGAGTARGGAGDDVIHAGGGVVWGEAGADTIIGTTVADNLSSAASGDDLGTERDSISAGAGNDHVSIGYGDHGDGGAGTDTLRYSFGGAAAGVDFNTAVFYAGPTTIGGGVVQNFESLVALRGSEFNDILRLANQSFRLQVDAGAGDDVIIAQASSVSVLGGAGDDRFVSSTAADTFNGGAGVDTIDYSAFAAGVTVNLRTGVGHGGDSLTSVEVALGSNYSDTITGGGAGTTVSGGGGDDVLNLARGDTATLGSGADLVVVTTGGHSILGPITITDWTVGDRLQFGTLTGAYAETTAGNYEAAVVAAESLAAAGYNFVAVGVGADVYVFGEPISGRLHFDGVVRLLGVTLDAVSADNVGLAGPLAPPITPTPTPTPTPGVVFAGTSGADSFNGGAGDDSLSGGIGDDTLQGGGGADTLDGGAGDDRLSSTTLSPPYDAPYAQTPASPPVLDTGREVDVLRGGDGNDRIFAGYGDQADGGAGTDQLFISFMGAPVGVVADFRLTTQYIGGGEITGFEVLGHIQGSDYADQIALALSAGVEQVVWGMGGNDTITAGYYTDVMTGDEGDDVLDARPSQYLSLVDGGAGNDVIYAKNGQANGGEGHDTIYGGGNVRGGAGDDRIYDNTGYAQGGSGDDLITAAANSFARLSGDDGADTLIGGSGGDTLYSAAIERDDMGAERDSLSGGGGNDTLSIGYGDHADGGAGTDFLRLSLGGAPTAIDFNTAVINAATPFTFGGGVIQNIEALTYLRGTEFNDILRLADQVVRLTVDGGAGDDVIIGQAGSVSVMGGAGNRFVSSRTADTFHSGEGADTIDYSGANAGVEVNLSWGSGPGGDILISVEGVVGTAFNDTLTGGGSNATLDGGAGNDTLNLYIGDVAYLGAGADVAIVNGVSSVKPIIIKDFSVEDTLRFASLSGTYAEAVAGTYSEALAAAKAKLAAGYNFVAVQTGADVYVFGDPVANRTDFYGVVRLENTTLNAVSADNVGIAGALVTPTPTPTPTPTATPTPTPTPTAPTAGDDTITGTPGPDALSGGAGNDVLYGLGGDDLLNGGVGADWMFGGPGNDVYIVDQPGDVVIELANEGYDRVDVGFTYSWTYVLPDNVEAARVVTGTRATTGAGLTGNSGANHLTGHDGANTLDGGAGNDTLVGGLGDDVYVIDSLQDVIVEAANGGTDRVDVKFAGAYTLGANLENARAVADVAVRTDLTGNDGANVLTGHDGLNSLAGGAGDDILIPGAVNSATAFDTVDGGAGNDTVQLRGVLASYLIERQSATEVTVVNSATGERVLLRDVEMVKFADVTLKLGALDGFAGDDLLVGTAAAEGMSGREGADALFGGGGADVLNGGVGVDTMIGGLGNDRYIVDNPLDVVIEKPGEGTDQIDVATQTSGVFTIAANVENARVQASVASRVDIIGNELANYILGHDGLNSLSGGAGDDLISAGLAGPLAAGGFDTINGGDGVDTVRMIGAASAYTLRFVSNDTYEVANKTTAERVLLRNVEFVQFTDQKLAVPVFSGPTDGDDNISGAGLIRGLGGNDTLTGGAGADTLDGGSGIDRLVGGGGADTYLVDRPEDVVVAGDGVDHMIVVAGATGSYVLAANVENATAQSTTDGVQALRVDLVGNGLNKRWSAATRRTC